MGNSTSIITPERFQEQIFSIVLYHLCPKANPGMRFVPDYDWNDASRRQSQTSMLNSLPVPENLTYEALIDYYKAREPRVRQYLESQVLNSEENLTRFYRIIISHLNANSHLTHPQSHTRKTKSKNQSKTPSSRHHQRGTGNSSNRHYPKPQRLTRSHLNEFGSHDPSILSNLESYANAQVSDANLGDFTHCELVNSRQSSRQSAKKKVPQPTSDGDETVPLPEVKRQLLEAYREGKLERGEALTEGDFDYTEAPHRQQRRRSPSPPLASSHHSLDESRKLASSRQSAGGTTNSHKASHKSLSDNEQPSSEGLPERIYDHNQKRSRSRSRQSTRQPSDLPSEDSPKNAPPSNYQSSKNDPDFLDEPSQSSLIAKSSSPRQSSRQSSRRKTGEESDADTMRYNKRFGDECAIED